MTKSAQIKAIAFDAYGTLFDVHSVIQACDEMFPDKGQSLSQLWRTKQLEYTWLLSLMGRYENFWSVTERALTFASKALGLNCGIEEREQLMKGYLRLDAYPEVESALNAMSSRKLVILSNGAPEMLESAVKNANIGDSLHGIISADEAKIFKPSPKVYQLAPDKLEVAANEIGFVSSNSWDVIGAKTFGFWTCWVNRMDAPLDELDVTPDLVVKSLDALAKTLTKS